MHFFYLEIKHLISEKSVDLLVIILEKCARSLRVNPAGSVHVDAHTRRVNFACTRGEGSTGSLQPEED